MARTHRPRVESVEVTSSVIVHHVVGDDATIRLSGLHFLDTPGRWAFTALWRGQQVMQGIVESSDVAEALHEIVMRVVESGAADRIAHTGDNDAAVWAFVRLGTLTYADFLPEETKLEDSHVAVDVRLLSAEVKMGGFVVPRAIDQAMAPEIAFPVVEHCHDGRFWNVRGVRVGKHVMIGSWPSDVTTGHAVTISVARGGCRIRLDY